MLKFSITVSVEPTWEPLSLTEAKDHLRVTDSTDDNDISAMIEAGRRHLEIETRRSIPQQTRLLKFDDGWPPFPIQLPYGPLQSVSSISYLDSNGDSQTWSSANYEVDTARDVIHLAYNVTTPSVRIIQNAVTITYVAGYASRAAIPEMFRHALKLWLDAEFNGCEVSARYWDIVAKLHDGSYP